MGKVLIIKGANFFANSFDNINIELPDGYRIVSSVFNSAITTNQQNETTSISTGVAVYPGYSIRGYFKLVTGNVNSTPLFSGYESDYPSQKVIHLGRNGLNNQQLIFGVYAPNMAVTTDIDTSQKNMYEIRGLELYINGTLIATQTAQPQLPSVQQCLMPKFFLGNVIIAGNFIIKDENSNIIFFGVPCVRESDDYAGIYDIISDRFLTNGLKNEYIE